MTRFLLVLVVIALALRAVWRLVTGIAEGAAASGGGRKGVGRGVPMVRDPVCGTFVVQSRALSAQIGKRVEFFCSQQCLQKRKANPSSGPTS